MNEQSTYHDYTQHLPPFYLLLRRTDIRTSFVLIDMTHDNTTYPHEIWWEDESTRMAIMAKHQTRQPTQVQTTSYFVRSGIDCHFIFTTKSCS